MWKIVEEFGLDKLLGYKKHGYRAFGDALGENKHGFNLEFYKSKDGVKHYLNNSLNYKKAIFLIATVDIEPEVFVKYKDLLV